RDDLVHAQGVGPLRLVAESVVAEDLLAFRDDRRIGRGARGVGAAACGERQGGCCGGERRGTACECHDGIPCVPVLRDRSRTTLANAEWLWIDSKSSASTR